MLLSKPPESLSIFEFDIKIKTDARTWLNISHRYSKSSIRERELMLFDTIIDINILEDIKNNIDSIEERQKIYNRIIHKLIDFLNCGHKDFNNTDKNKQEVSRQTFDFEIDSNVIFSAFYRTYRIDICEELDTLHWWKFNALFNDLDSESLFIRYYQYYRNFDFNSDYFKNLKARDKNKIYKYVNDVSLNKNKIENKKLSRLDVMRLKAKENKGL